MQNLICKIKSFFVNIFFIELLGLAAPGIERIHFIACMVAKCVGPEAKKSENGTIDKRNPCSPCPDNCVQQ